MTRIGLMTLLAMSAGVANGGDLYFQGFESQGVGYTTSIAEFSDLGVGTGIGEDYFTVSDGSNIASNVNYSNTTGNFFGAQDIDGEGAGLPVYLTTDVFNIAGATNLQFAVDLAEDNASDGNEDWDAFDYVAFEYKLDNGLWRNIFNVLYDQNEPDDFNAFAQVDGTEITDAFTTFTADLSALSGTTLQLRVTWYLDAGDEDLAIDNLRVSVVPLPSAAWAGLGMLGLLAGGKLRRR